MRTKNGHEIWLNLTPGPYGPTYGCRRCGMASMVYRRMTEQHVVTEQEVVEALDAEGSRCNPPQIVLDRERGKHECPEAAHAEASHDSFLASKEVLKGEDGVWGVEICGGDAGLNIAFCPFCGAKLGDLPPAKSGAGRLPPLA